MIDGPAGPLEARLKSAGKPDAPLAIILHPNPRFGGNMNTPTVYNLFNCFADTGASTCRFNFRGVGKSGGEFGSGEGEIADTLAVIDWIRGLGDTEGKDLWICGFSYGAWIASRLITRLDTTLSGTVLVAPPVGKYDFPEGRLPVRKGLVIHGEQDELIPSGDVWEWADGLETESGDPFLKEAVEGADHFFREHQDALTRIVTGFIQ